MPKTPFLEQKSSIRGLGVAFIAMMLFFIWLTYAVFTQKFISSVPVTITTSNVGLAFPSNADVKLRGMIVGEVRSVKPTATGVKINIAMQPKTMHLIPKDVTAQIVPKTLFGEKYISLVPDANRSPETLKAGDNISTAVVPIEVETLLNDLYPLLQAVQPAELSSTLTAVSTALSGRGEKLGTTLVDLNKYLEQVNPDVPQLINDLTTLGKVSDGYAAAMPELGRLLKNVVVTGNTVVAKRAQLEAFFQEGTKLANSTSDLVDKNGDNIVTLAREGRPVVELLSRFSPTFPCTFKALTDVVPHLNSVFRGGKVHINLILEPLSPTSPSGYAADESGTIPSESQFDDPKNADFLAPSCHTLPNTAKVYSSEPGHYTPLPPFEIFKLLGFKTDHGKLDGRTAIANDTLINMVQPSADGVDTTTQRNDLKSLLAASSGVSAADVPDVASLMMGPMFRDAEVKVSEAR